MVKGYESIYYIKPYFVKEYVNKETLENEVSAIREMNKVKVDGIITPKIISYEGNKLIQEYVKGEKFHLHLFKNCNLFYYNKKLENIFYNFGSFLAELHKHTAHKDLNSKNIMFVGDSLYLFDPGTKGNPIRDLATLLINMRPFKFFINPFVNRKKLRLLENKFLEGYGSVDRKELNEQIKKLVIERRKSCLKKDLIYRTKKSITNVYEGFLLWKQL